MGDKPFNAFDKSSHRWLKPSVGFSHAILPRGYSSVAEHRSSKSATWVRFLLPLLLKKRKRSKIIPSYFPPTYRSFKRTRSSRFMLRLSQPPLVQRHKRPNHLTLRYARASRLLGLPRQLDKARKQYSFSFFKQSSLFAGKSFTLDTSSLGVLFPSTTRRTSSLPLEGASRSVQTTIPSYIPHLVGRMHSVSPGGYTARKEWPTPVTHISEGAAKYCVSSSIGN